MIKQTGATDAEFKKLFWAARKEHIWLTKTATVNDPAHKAAIAFAQTHNWKWAEELIEASRLEASGEETAALKSMTACETSIPEQYRGHLYFIRGNALAGKGDHDEAIKAFRKALAEPSFDTPAYAWNNIGYELGAKGDHDEAIKACRKALAEPNYDTPGLAWNNIGNALAGKGDFDEAIKAYRNALAEPNHDKWSGTWVNLGTIYYAAGKTELAREAFNKALAAPDPAGSSHARARFRLGLLESNLKLAALSADDRALVERSLFVPATDNPEARLIGKIKDAGESQYDRYLEKEDSKRNDILSILRGWSSAVTLLEGSERRWRGGGYFLKWRGCGIVIDPGFDFLRNFHDAGFHGREINMVLVSHNHPDHNDDLKSIDDLRYEIYKRRATKKGAGISPYVILWDEDTKGATKFSAEHPEHHYPPITFTTGLPVTLDLLTKHAAKFPVRVTPFNAEHSDDAPSAMGAMIELLDQKGGVALRIGYTGDTAYFDALPGHLSKCDVLIAHISQPTVDELQDPAKGKKEHLGYRGTARLLKECKPKLALLAEFWAGFTDIRIDLVKGLRMRSGCEAILPAGIGMHVHLPDLKVECTACGTPTAHAQVNVTPPTENFGNLAYLCPTCLLR